MYYFLTLGFAILVYLSREILGDKGRPLNILISFAFSVLCAYRFIGNFSGHYYGGIDAHAYKEIYQSVTTQGFLETFAIQPWEYGFSLIFWLSSNAGLSFELFQLIFYCIFYYLIIKITHKYSRGASTFLLALVLAIAVIDSFNLLRNYVAFVFGAASLFLHARGNLKSSLAFLVIALSIHISAIAIILFYFSIYFYSKNKLVYYVTILLLFLTSILLANFFIHDLLAGHRIEYYLYAEKSEFPLGTYAATVIYFIILNKLFNRSPFDGGKFKPWNAILLTSIILAPINYIHPMIYRLFFYYIFVLNLLIFASLSKLRTTNLNLKIWSLNYTSILLIYPAFEILKFFLYLHNNELSAEMYKFNFDLL